MLIIHGVQCCVMVLYNMFSRNEENGQNRGFCPEIARTYSRKEEANMIIAGIIVEVQRKVIKNIHIHVKAPMGKVIVTAPKRTSDRTIIKIVEERKRWIKDQQAKMAMRMQNRMDDDIDWEEQRIELREKITKLLPKWEEITKLYSSSWQIRKMKTRWGSCNIKTKKIWFNLHLAQTTNSCLEYIILHELLHIRVPNHGKEFKEQMDKYMPQWREVRKELNQYVLF